MVCVPAPSDETLSAALPADRAAVPRVVLPSRYVTLPVGVPAPEESARTVAVKVTLCPKLDGSTDEVSVVVVSCASTTWLSCPLLPVKLASPAYCALSECVPTASDETAR